MHSLTSRTPVHRFNALESSFSRSTLTSKNKRQFSAPPSAAPAGKPESSKKETPKLQNMALATGLFGFVGYVFFYSMNSVGRADGKDDPLAQLKAEAHEALQDANQQNKKKLTPEEIQALESGMSYSAGSDVEVAVAAPADIAAIEEEANLKVFRNNQQNESGSEKPKKPWWRFGF
jgi:hypothetical protein